MFHVGMSFFVLVCVISPTASSPNIFRHPWMPVGRNHSVLQPANKLGQRLQSTQPKKPWYPSKIFMNESVLKHG